MKKDGKSLEKEVKTGARLTHWKEMLTAGVSLRSLWVGNKGLHSLGEGKASPSHSKTHSALQIKPVLTWNSSLDPHL